MPKKQYCIVNIMESRYKFMYRLFLICDTSLSAKTGFREKEIVDDFLL